MRGQVNCTSKGCGKRVSLLSINNNKKGVLQPNGVNISLRQSPVCGRVACSCEGCGKRVLCSCNFLISCYSNETIAFKLKVFGKILFVGIFDPVRGRACLDNRGL